MSAAAPHHRGDDDDEDVNPLVAGGAMLPSQFSSVVVRWQRRRADMASLSDRLAKLREAQRRDDAIIRGYMERHDRKELPTSVRGPDGNPRQTGTLWLSNPRAVPKPITKRHLSDLLGEYDRIDVATAEHLKNYLWTNRQFSDEVVTVNFDAFCEDGAPPPGSRPPKRRRASSRGDEE